MFLLLALGCDLLLSANLLTNENPDYGTVKRAYIIIESTPIKRIFTLERSRGSRNLYANIPSSGEDGVIDSSTNKEAGVHNYLSRAISMANEDNERNRREAWKKLLSVRHIV